jgi:hypothetical protein
LPGWGFADLCFEGGGVKAELWKRRRVSILLYKGGAEESPSVGGGRLRCGDGVWGKPRVLAELLGFALCADSAPTQFLVFVFCKPKIKFY